jgi:ankyrin repeat protein
MKTDELFNAIRQNDADAVAALLDEDPALLAATSQDITPILFAVYHGHPDLAELFTDRGAELSAGELAALGDDRALDGDLDSYSQDGFPLLGLAIFFRHPELARAMIERGANVNARARNQAGVMPVHAAAAVGDIETMRLLLDRGADANARDKQDSTPIMFAAQHGHAETVGRLLEAAPDLDVQGDHGFTALGFARQNGHDETTRLLEQAGAAK